MSAVMEQQRRSVEASARPGAAAEAAALSIPKTMPQLVAENEQLRASNQRLEESLRSAQEGLRAMRDETARAKQEAADAAEAVQAAEARVAHWSRIYNSLVRVHGDAMEAFRAMMARAAVAEDQRQAFWQLLKFRFAPADTTPGLLVEQAREIMGSLSKQRFAQWFQQDDTNMIELYKQELSESRKKGSENP